MSSSACARLWSPSCARRSLPARVFEYHPVSGRIPSAGDIRGHPAHRHAQRAPCASSDPSPHAGGEEARCAGEIHLRYPVPATLKPGARACLELVWGGLRVARSTTTPIWVRRETIEGSSLVLARRLVSTRRGLIAGPEVPGLSR